MQDDVEDSNCGSRVCQAKTDMTRTCIDPVIEDDALCRIAVLNFRVAGRDWVNNRIIGLVYQSFRPFKCCLMSARWAWDNVFASFTDHREERRQQRRESREQLRLEACILRGV